MVRTNGFLTSGVAGPVTSPPEARPAAGGTWLPPLSSSIRCIGTHFIIKIPKCWMDLSRVVHPYLVVVIAGINHSGFTTLDLSLTQFGSPLRWGLPTVFLLGFVLGNGATETPGRPPAKATEGRGAMEGRGADRNSMSTTKDE